MACPSTQSLHGCQTLRWIRRALAAGVYISTHHTSRLLSLRTLAAYPLSLSMRLPLLVEPGLQQKPSPVYPNLLCYQTAPRPLLPISTQKTPVSQPLVFRFLPFLPPLDSSLPCLCVHQSIAIRSPHVSEPIGKLTFVGLQDLSVGEYIIACHRSVLHDLSIP